MDVRGLSMDDFEKTLNKRDWVNNVCIHVTSRHYWKRLQCIVKYCQYVHGICLFECTGRAVHVGVHPMFCQGWTRVLCNGAMSFWVGGLKHEFPQTCFPTFSDLKVIFYTSWLVESLLWWLLTERLQGHSALVCVSSVSIARRGVFKQWRVHV